MLLFVGIGSQMALVEDTSAADIAAVLEQSGPGSSVCALNAG
jgi:hypothetical protein